MDARYQVAKEFCGYPRKKWVARFCGEWIGKGDNKSDAVMICLAHADKRERALNGEQ